MAEIDQDDDPGRQQDLPEASRPSAYSSWLTLSFNTAADAIASTFDPSATDTDDDDLRELRRRVVEPVVAGLLTEGELENLTVYRLSGTEEVWVRLTAVDEEFNGLLTGAPGLTGSHLQEVAERMADLLQDWVCETHFAWGQQRIAHFVLPPD